MSQDMHTHAYDTDNGPRQAPADQELHGSSHVNNPSIVLGIDYDTFYALAFTSVGVVRGAVCRDRQSALQALGQAMDQQGATL